jgi:hypothetical protein
MSNSNVPGGELFLATLNPAETVFSPLQTISPKTNFFVRSTVGNIFY